MELFPLIIRRITAEVYVVARADGAGALRTSPLGAEAVRLLRQIGSVEAVTLELGRRHDRGIDLKPLLASLASARLVRVADGVEVKADRPNPFLILKGYWRLYVDWAVRAPVVLLRSLPIPAALLLTRAVNRRRLWRSSYGAKVRHIADVLPRSRDDGQSKAIAARHIAELADTDALARLVCAAPTQRLHRWLNEAVTLEGVEHLERARSKGRGVVFTMLHASAYPLVIVKLASVGVRFHSFNFGTRFSDRRFDQVMESHARSAGWAVPQFYYRATRSNLAQYVRRVRGGECGILMPDYYGPERSSDGTRTTAVAVPFGERRALVHTFAGWVLRTTGATVVPCEAVRAGSGYRIRLQAPISELPLVPEFEPDAAITRWIFELLATPIIEHPERWTFLLSYVAAPAGMVHDVAQRRIPDPQAS